MDAKEKDSCLRCGGDMRHLGNERIQLGKFGFFTGSLGNLLDGALDVQIHVCTKCNKLEFYLL